MKILIAFLLVTAISVAMFGRSEQVPIERLRENIAQDTKLDPAYVQYTLGRLDSMVFSGIPESTNVSKRLTGNELWRSGRESALKPRTLTDLEYKMFLSSVEHYRKAIELRPSDPLYHYSYGWMAESALVSTPKPREPGFTPWEDVALREYRLAFELAPKNSTANLLGGVQPAVEAAAALIRILRNKPNAAKEIAAAQAEIDRVNRLPRAITPLIFSTRPNTQLAALISPKTTKFNLDATGEGRDWPWLQPDTAILVWNPSRDGHIADGRQLFGSVTWWMFWSNGFDPLNALDDNHDGWLTGRELDGLAIWQDRNCNGISDPGEVTPTEQFGIVALRTIPDGALHATKGVRMRDGREFTLYDWTPESRPLPLLSRRSASLGVPDDFFFQHQ